MSFIISLPEILVHTSHPVKRSLRNLSDIFKPVNYIMAESEECFVADCEEREFVFVITHIIDTRN